MKSEGANVTFYDMLGVKPGANQDDLNKARGKCAVIDFRMQEANEPA